MQSRQRTVGIDAKLKEAEDAAARGDFCKLVKTLSGKATQTLPLKGMDGKPLKSQEEEAKTTLRWKEHSVQFLIVENQQLRTTSVKNL